MIAANLNVLLMKEMSKYIFTGEKSLKAMVAIAALHHVTSQIVA